MAFSLSLRKHNVYVLLFSAWVLLSPPLNAAQLTIKVTDTAGKPIKDAFAVLVPTTLVKYSNTATAVIDQRDNSFSPSVMAIRVNTSVRFPNSDDVRHHVYSFSPSKKFELRLYHGMTAEPVLFDVPGTVVLGCNIHDSMVAHIYVVESEHYAGSTAQGDIQLAAPAGQYRLQIHHPQLNGDYPESLIGLQESDVQQKTIVLDNMVPAKSDDADEFSHLF